MSKTNLKPQQDVQPRPAEPAVDRLHHCKTMLYVHGFLSESEAARVQDRLVKWVINHRNKQEPPHA